MNDATEITTTEMRTTEQGNTVEVAAIRAFLLRTLADDLLVDEVSELLFEHVAAGRYHRTVVAESLRPIVEEAPGRDHRCGLAGCGRPADCRGAGARGKT
jgi:hypothetical protein